MRIMLTIRSRDAVDCIAELSWSEGRARLISAAAVVRSELEELISEGLSEWVGVASEAHPRMTFSSDARFLERLAGYLRRQSGFLIELRQDEPPVKRRDVAQWPPRRGAPVRHRVEGG